MLKKQSVEEVAPSDLAMEDRRHIEFFNMGGDKSEGGVNSESGFRNIKKVDSKNRSFSVNHSQTGNLAGKSTTVPRFLISKKSSEPVSVAMLKDVVGGKRFTASQ